MGAHDAEYIAKFQPRTRSVSDCCIEEIEPASTHRSMYCNVEPAYICSKCGKRCKVLEIEEEKP